MSLHSSRSASSSSDLSVCCMAASVVGLERPEGPEGLGLLGVGLGVELRLRAGFCGVGRARRR